MILFHDMEKTNSKLQFGKSAEGEHRLTVEMMARYRQLWRDELEFKLVKGMVAGDPIGIYMKTRNGGDQIRNKTFMEIVGIARTAGIAAGQYRQFFNEFNQFYQADFSSYTPQSSYRTRNDKALEPSADKKGESTFERFFVPGDDDAFQYNEERQRFIYNALDDYEKKMLALEDMFASTEVILEHIRNLDPFLKTLPGKQSDEQIMEARKRKKEARKRRKEEREARKSKLDGGKN